MALSSKTSLDPILSKDNLSLGSDDVDTNIIDWEGPFDQQNPKNWSKWRKLTSIALVSSISFLVPLASSIMAPGVPQILKDFDTTSPLLSTFVVSVYVLGMGSGPLVMAPMSELYGRAPAYHFLNISFVIFTVGCALSTNFNMLIVFRFLAGLVGGGPIAIGAGSIADVTNPHERATAMSIWSTGALLGPCIGPVAGGFISRAAGWRWVFWTVSIIAAAVTVACLTMMHETHAPTILEKKARQLRKSTGNPHLYSALDLQLAPKDLFMLSLVRPSKLFCLSPICLLLSIYAAFVYAICYLMISTFTFVFKDIYGFKQEIAGLTFLALGVGFVIGLVTQQYLGGKAMEWLAHRRNKGQTEPEYRLATTILAAVFIPAGLFLYGWTAQNHVHWIVPLLGTGVAGAGIIIVFVAVNSYLVDIFNVYAASALAATTVLRCIFGATFPLFALRLYQTMGLGWGNSLLGFLSVALLWPIPCFIFFYGKWLRTHPRFQVRL